VHSEHWFFEEWPVALLAVRVQGMLWCYFEVDTVRLK
jgi:hypothetical protein